MLLKRMIEKLIRNKIINVDNYFHPDTFINCCYDDVSLLNLIRRNKDELGDLYLQWKNRRYLKSCWKNVFEYEEKIPDEMVRKSLMDLSRKDTLPRTSHIVRSYEQSICNFLNLDDDLFHITYAGFKPLGPREVEEILIKVKPDVPKDLKELSIYNPLAEKVRNMVFMYVEDGYQDKCIEYIKNNPPVT